MIDSIRWLIEMEFMAGRLYAESASFFSGDKELSDFLYQLRDDEVSLYNAMNRVDDILRQDVPEFRCAITLDRNTRDRLEKPLMRYRQRLTSAELMPGEMIEYIITLEYSEFNDFLGYIIDAVREFDPEFHQRSSQIEVHRCRIEEFVATLPERRRYCDLIERMRRCRIESILIVDSEPAILRFLSSVFQTRFSIETARDGEDALEKTEANNFDVIISDLTLPVLSGIEWYLSALKNDPGIGNRVLFLSGETTADTRRFIQDQNLAFLDKPVTLAEITTAVSRLVRSSESV